MIVLNSSEPFTSEVRPVCLTKLRDYYYYYYYYYYYLLQLSFHLVAAVLALVTNKNKYT